MCMPVCIIAVLRIAICKFFLLPNKWEVKIFTNKLCLYMHTCSILCYSVIIINTSIACSQYSPAITSSGCTNITLLPTNSMRHSIISEGHWSIISTYDIPFISRPRSTHLHYSNVIILCSVIGINKSNFRFITVT